MTLDQEIAFTFTAAEANILLQTLAEAPYRVSAPLIDKIRQQIMTVDPTAFTGPVPTTVQRPNGQEFPR